MRLESENHEGTFYVLDVPDWVNIIALTPQKEVVLVEQYRYGIENPSLEIPGGMCDEAGESPLATARRELREETGFVSGNWTPLGRVSANPAIQNNYIHFFLAEECSHDAETNFDRHERIVTHLLPYRDFLNRVEDETIDNCIVVAALAKYLLREM